MVYGIIISPRALANWYGYANRLPTTLTGVNLKAGWDLRGYGQELGTVAGKEGRVGQLGKVGGRKRSLRSQGAANLRIFSFQLRAARPAARTSLACLGYLCFYLCPRPLATCVWHLRLCSGHWHRSHTYRQGQSLRSFGSEMQRSTAQTKRHLVAWSMLKSLGCRLTCSACSGLGISVGSRVAWLWCLGLWLGLIH